MLRKRLPLAALVFVLTGFAGPALAQMPMPGLTFGKDKPPPTADQVERQKQIDNAYSAASKRFPRRRWPTTPGAACARARSPRPPRPPRQKAGSSRQSPATRAAKSHRGRPQNRRASAACAADLCLGG